MPFCRSASSILMSVFCASSAEFAASATVIVAFKRSSVCRVYKALYAGAGKSRLVGFIQDLHRVKHWIGQEML